MRGDVNGEGPVEDDGVEAGDEAEEDGCEGVLEAEDESEMEGEEGGHGTAGGDAHEDAVGVGEGHADGVKEGMDETEEEVDDGAERELRVGRSRSEEDGDSAGDESGENPSSRASIGAAGADADKILRCSGAGLVGATADSMSCAIASDGCGSLGVDDFRDMGRVEDCGAATNPVQLSLRAKGLRGEHG